MQQEAWQRMGAHAAHHLLHLLGLAGHPERALLQELVCLAANDCQRRQPGASPWSSSMLRAPLSHDLHTREILCARIETTSGDAAH
jgi:hypothetical protein